MQYSIPRTIVGSDLVAAKLELSRAQDEFYRTMTEWIISHMNHGGGRECYKFALIYNDAIDRYIVCLDREEKRLEVNNARRSAKKLKSILSTDLHFLSQFRLADRSPEAANGRPSSE